MSGVLNERWVVGANGLAIYTNRTMSRIVADFDVGSASMSERKERALLCANAPALFDLVVQYRNDMMHFPTGDSILRRLAAINAAIAKVPA